MDKRIHFPSLVILACCLAVACGREDSSSDTSSPNGAQAKSTMALKPVVIENKNAHPAYITFSEGSAKSQLTIQPYGIARPGCKAACQVVLRNGNGQQAGVLATKNVKPDDKVTVLNAELFVNAVGDEVFYPIP